jgi:hypothetical protein
MVGQKALDMTGTFPDFGTGVFQLFYGKIIRLLLKIR